MFTDPFESFFRNHQMQLGPFIYYHRPKQPYEQFKVILLQNMYATFCKSAALHSLSLQDP